MSDIIKLETCFSWFCPKCDQENYTHGTPAGKLDDGEDGIAYMSENQNVWMQYPTRVSCIRCKGEYPVAPPAEEDLHEVEE